jgi:membrane protease YdiL (CAAX protease family)
MPFGWYFLNTTALSIVFTWFFQKTGGSVLLAILLHGGMNAPSGWIPPELFHSYAYFTAATWFIAIVLIVDYGPTRFFRKG